MIESGDEDVHRFRRDRLHDLRDLSRITDAGRIETIGSGFGLGGESFEDGVRWIGIVHQPRFTTSR